LARRSYRHQHRGRFPNCFRWPGCRTAGQGIRRLARVKTAGQSGLENYFKVNLVYATRRLSGPTRLSNMPRVCRRGQLGKFGDRKAFPLSFRWKWPRTLSCVLPTQSLLFSVLPADNVWTEISLIAIVYREAAYPVLQRISQQVICL